MGAEEKAKEDAPQMKKENGEVPPVPPPEEPPKLEDIVTPEVLKAIIDGYNRKAKLITFRAQPGSKIGDNYMSIMFAVELDLETEKGPETLHIMLKTIPRNEFRAEMINEMMAFKKETIIYQEVFPKMVTYQKARGIPEEQIFEAWPVCYAAHLDGTTDFLSMENLKIKGYKMGSRVSGLDFNHTALVLRNLARYHAASYAMHGGNRDSIIQSFPALANGMFNKESKVSEMQQQFFSQSFLMQSGQLKEIGEDVASDRMMKISKLDLMDILGKLTTQNIEHAIITHGDCWVNNMLFKYAENDDKSSHPTDVKFIDFQISMASSRMIDVFYFLMTSCMIDVLTEREQDLLMIYYSEFTSSVQNLGVDTKERGLSWDNFLKEADKFKLYGVVMGLLLAPMLSADAADIPDMDSFTKEDMENQDEAMAKFFKDLSKDASLKKVKVLATVHLSRCQGLESILALAQK